MRHCLKYLAILGLIWSHQTPALATGEKYASQGNRLSMAITQYLIEKKICVAGGQACSKKLETYGGHGNRVNYSVYGADKQALSAMLTFIIEHGIKVTDGVPISVFVYPNSRISYGSMLFNEPSPVLTLKVDQ